jgi:tRNA_anti-like
MKSILALLSLTMLTACQSASLGAQKPVSAGNLTKEYEESSALVRGKYDGKEITVRGYALIAGTMPKSGDDQGSILLEEKGREPGGQVACWFSKEQAAEFSKIKGGEYLTVKGVFNGEVSAELKFCKLVKVE